LSILGWRGWLNKKLKNKSEIFRLVCERTTIFKGTGKFFYFGIQRKKNLKVLKAVKKNQE